MVHALLTRLLTASLKPSRWATWSRRWAGPLALLSTALTLVGLYWVFALAPEADAQQGVYYKILYLHVPTAWLAVALYGGMALLGGVYLVAKSPVAALLGRSMAQVGLVLCAVCLLTGSLWGKPMWGTYWVWDARLTSMALLALLYIGYLVLGTAFAHPATGWRRAAFLALVGSLNLPIIKWSVTWWTTLHQPATFLRAEGSALHPSMAEELVLMK